MVVSAPKDPPFRQAHKKLSMSKEQKKKGVKKGMY